MAQPSPKYTGDELRALLAAGAAGGAPTTQAAMHLLTFTDLPDRAAFAGLVEVVELDVVPGAPDRAAFVRDWKALPTSAAADRLPSGQTRLLALAVSLATGEPVDLRENLPVGGHAHARRVIEAMAIATGSGELYEVTPTPKLGELLAFHESLNN